MKKILLPFMTLLNCITGIAQNKISVTEFLPEHDGDYRLAIKAAIEKAIAIDTDTIYFPAGIYRVGFDRGRIVTCEGSQVHTAINLCKVSKLLVFAGDGENSVIELGEIPQTGDYHIFQLIASDSIQFLKITLDGKMDINNYNEQRHLVYVQGCKSIGFESVLFRYAKGDGIKLIGLSATRPTKDVIIKNCKFFNNGRSGVAFLKYTEDVSVMLSEFSLNSDQDIDFEPDDEIERWLVKNVSIKSNKFTHYNKTVTVTLSNGADIQFNNNIIINGSIHARHLKDFLITNNQFLRNDEDLTKNVRIHLQGDITYGLIASNIIDSSRNNIALQINHDRDNIGNHIQILNNTIYGPLNIQDVKNVLIEGNTIICKKEVFGTVGINFKTESGKEDKQDIVIRNNTIKNFEKGIQLAPRYSNYTSVLIENNFFEQIRDECIYYNHDPTRGKILQMPKLLYNRYKDSNEFYKKIGKFTLSHPAVIYGYNGDLQTPVYLGNTAPPSILTAPSNSIYIYYNTAAIIPPNLLPNPQYYLLCGGNWKRIELGCP